MSKPHFAYSVTHGLAGCYMPDSQSGPITGTTRRELADAIRYELEFKEWPAYLIREVRLSNLWAHIKRHGSSSAHFCIRRDEYKIAFHGLTDAEAEQMQAEEA